MLQYDGHNRVGCDRKSLNISAVFRGKPLFFSIYPTCTGIENLFYVFVA